MAGYLESVYQQALAIEFREMGIAHKAEHAREVFYRGPRAGEHKLDFMALRRSRDRVEVG